MSCIKDLFLKSALALLSEFASAFRSIETFDTLLFAELVGAELFVASVASVRLSVDVGLDSIVYSGICTDSEPLQWSTASYDSLCCLCEFCALRQCVPKRFGDGKRLASSPINTYKDNIRLQIKVRFGYFYITDDTWCFIKYQLYNYVWNIKLE